MINDRKNDNDFAKSFISNGPSICISNGGNIEDKYKDETDIALRLKEIHMSVNTQSFMGTKDSFTTVVTMLNSQSIFINVNYPYPLISDAKIDQFIASLYNKITCEEMDYCF